jgi:hypothetical protein
MKIFHLNFVKNCRIIPTFLHNLSEWCKNHIKFYQTGSLWPVGLGPALGSQALWLRDGCSRPSFDTHPSLAYCLVWQRWTLWWLWLWCIWLLCLWQENCLCKNLHQYLADWAVGSLTSPHQNSRICLPKPSCSLKLKDAPSSGSKWPSHKLPGQSVWGIPFQTQYIWNYPGIYRLDLYWVGNQMLERSTFPFYTRLVAIESLVFSKTLWHIFGKTFPVCLRLATENTI